MYAVIFEVKPTKSGTDEYLELAKMLKAFLCEIDGFISIERFQSINEKGKILSLSFWQNEEAIEKWRNLLEHRIAQEKGHFELFEDYQIRVAKVQRNYTKQNREEAPTDSNKALKRYDFQTS